MKSFPRSQTAEHDINVCLHRVGSGHYTAYGSHEGRWYHFNDSTVTLTSEDTVRKAKAYILFYVERTGQVAGDKTATNSTPAKPPAVDTVTVGGVSSEAVAQDKVATNSVLVDAAASHMVTLDEKAPDNATLEIVGNDMAALDEADTASVEAATDMDTSDKATTEEASQAIQTVGQWFCQTLLPQTSSSLHFGITSITFITVLDYNS